jgi:DNA-binding IclR family transcriptional regulator
MSREPIASDPSGAAGPRSVLRVLHLLRLLATHSGGLSLSALAKALDIPKTSMHSMLQPRLASRFIVRDDRLLRLGPAGVALGLAISGVPRRFPECAQGLLRELSERTGETALLAELTPDRKSCRYVAAVESDNWLRFSVPVGSLKPAYATGSGQAMLAHLSRAQRADALAGVKFERLTARTVSSHAALNRALAVVRAHGVSVVDSGTVSGVISIAAPIFDQDGRCMASITIGGPASRLQPRVEELISAVRNCASEISGILGYQGD